MRWSWDTGVYTMSTQEVVVGHRCIHHEMVVGHRCVHYEYSGGGRGTQVYTP